MLAPPRAESATVFGMLDVLASVGRDWQMLNGGPPAKTRTVAHLLSADGLAFEDANGRTLQPDGSLDDHPDCGVVIVPQLFFAPSDPLPDDTTPYQHYLRAAARRDAIIASVCTGAFVLAEAGLLDGLEATTHWAYWDAFRTRYPEVLLRGERILVPTGEGHRIVTAGGAFAWTDLLIYLIARLAGAEEARCIARIHLLQSHPDGQLTYASLTATRQHDDQLVADAQVWAAEHYARAHPVAEMVARSGLTERSFLRRFRKVTGQSPAEYVQTLRIEEAKQMLETTDLTVDAVAREVGYAEGSSFRHVFRKRVGITASAYRRRRVPERV